MDNLNTNWDSDKLITAFGFIYKNVEYTPTPTPRTNRGFSDSLLLSNYNNNEVAKYSEAEKMAEKCLSDLVSILPYILHHTEVVDLIRVFNLSIVRLNDSYNRVPSFDLVKQDLQTNLPWPSVAVGAQLNIIDQTKPYLDLYAGLLSVLEDFSKELNRWNNDFNENYKVNFPQMIESYTAHSNELKYIASKLQDPANLYSPRVVDTEELYGYLADNMNRWFVKLMIYIAIETNELNGTIDTIVEKTYLSNVDVIRYIKASFSA